jgi:hypothetical protein
MNKNYKDYLEEGVNLIDEVELREAYCVVTSTLEQASRGVRFIGMSHQDMVDLEHMREALWDTLTEIDNS